MTEIVSEIVEILKSSNDLLEVELKILRLFSSLLCEALGTSLERLDQELEKDANVKVLRRDQRTIQFLFGEVTFKRRLVEETGGYHVYLLDRHLGIKPRKRYSPLLLARVSGLASKGVMRTVASAVNLLTPISMSHQKVAGVIKEAGARIDNYQRQQRINDTVEKNKPMILYLEGDAFSVKQQAFHHNRQIRNLFVHRFQIYEGIRKNGKRRELINRHIISSLDRQQAMKEVSEYLQAHYDLKKTIIISGSDNGSGYEAEVFKELAPDYLKQEHFLDQYHLNRKIQERLSFDFELIKPMKKAVYSWNWNQVRVILDTAESRITKEDQAGQEKRMALRKLENYLKRNWQYIKPAKLRGVKKPNGLGSCESNHRRYTYRLKRQGRSWSKAGLKAMLRIIDAQQNEGLVGAMRFKELAKRFTHQVKDKLSSLKLFEKVQAPHIGVLQGRIVQDAPSSSAIGRLAKIF